jgi:hypothetical protein
MYSMLRSWDEEKRKRKIFLYILTFSSLCLDRLMTKISRTIQHLLAPSIKIEKFEFNTTNIEQLYSSEIVK